jgi:CubicO group peptidase (beta-lactamase class C family)
MARLCGGMAATPLPRTIEVINAGIAQGLHLGAQVYVWHDGRVIGDLAIGLAREGVPMASNSLPLWLSAGKPLAAIAIAQLVQRKLLKLDDVVAVHIPEFAQHGKQDVTIRHLLMHTSPIRSAASNITPQSWEELIGRICEAEPDWPSGTRAGYHPASSWLLLGELVRRLDGRRYERYVVEEIFAPCDMTDCSVGMTAQQYDAWKARLTPLYSIARKPVNADSFLNTRESCLSCRPGANARGPIRMLGQFFQMLLAGGHVRDEVVVDAELVRQFTSRQRIRMFDETFEQPLDWGLGFMVDSKRNFSPPQAPAYGMGALASDQAYGHGGKESTNAFADPAHKLVVAWVCNGMPGEAAHQQRNNAINRAIYEDLGLG